MSDIARRYLIPAIDCGVVLEGKNGAVTAQVIQCVRLLPDDPCPADAVRRGDEGAAYWQGLPQLNTVGYLTTMAGAMAAGYAIGWITGRFTPPFSRLQMNLLAPFFDVTNLEQSADEDCACRRARGWADQGAADALISAPPHWQTIRSTLPNNEPRRHRYTPVLFFETIHGQRWVSSRRLAAERPSL